jgi:hypothetical protein
VFVVDDERHSAMAQARLEHNQPANATVTVFDGEDLFEPHMYMRNFCFAWMFIYRRFSSMHLENRIAPAGSYTGSADSTPRRDAERAHRRIAAKRQPANTRSKRA